MVAQEHNKVLIICKASQKKITWEKHLLDILGENKQDIHIIKDRKDKYQGKKWTIVSINICNDWIKLNAKNNFDYLIVDEVHRCIDTSGKHGSTFYRGAMKGSRRSNNVLLLTGTPMITGYENFMLISKSYQVDMKL